VLLGDFRQDLIDHETRITAPEAVVLIASIFAALEARSRCRQYSGIDENTDGQRHAALLDEVVEYDGNAPRARLVHKARSVLEQHHTGRFRTVILGRDVDP